MLYRNDDDEHFSVYTDLGGLGSWNERVTVATCRGQFSAGDRLVAGGTTASAQPITSNTVVLPEAC